MESGSWRLVSLFNYYSCLYGPLPPPGTVTPNDWLAISGQIRHLPGSAVVQLQLSIGLDIDPFVNQSIQVDQRRAILRAI